MKNGTKHLRSVHWGDSQLAYRLIEPRALAIACGSNRTKSLPFNGILEADGYCVIVAMCIETKQFGR